MSFSEEEDQDPLNSHNVCLNVEILQAPSQAQRLGGRKQAPGEESAEVDQGGAGEVGRP